MEIYSRGKWLLGLLIVQSTSGVVLQNFEKLIEKHLVITFFLTMLVGASLRKSACSKVIVRVPLSEVG